VTTTHRRLLAVAALVLTGVAIAGALAIAAAAFPRGLLAIAFIAIAVPLAWHGLLRRGAARWASLVIAGLLLVAVLVLMIVIGPVLAELGVIVALMLAIAAARAAFTVRAELPAAQPPKRAVVFWNPKSGGGKAEKAHLADEARKRGIEPIELQRGDDLAELVNKAVADGADAVAAAGGDGTQAIIAAAAAEHGLPYACIPAGTRNHFALDLGVDRNDVVGALDAFVNGRERRIDLAEINGKVFVNNVSLGLYAEAVQQEGYREAKLRTILDSVPGALGPDGEGLDLHWTGPEGEEHDACAAILVSNNGYRLGAVSSGTRPRLDDGVLGITVFAADTGVEQPPSRAPWIQWTTPEFEVRSGKGVPAGIDGEAVVLEAPLHFAIRPGALTVRIAPQHPGASPSAGLPTSPGAAMQGLVALAAGREPTLS
jgi:diacylglycerol kinase family enzyme